MKVNLMLNGSLAVTLLLLCVVISGIIYAEITHERNLRIETAKQFNSVPDSIQIEVTYYGEN